MTGSPGGLDRPLIICDVDEVLVHFLQGFEAYLEERDLWLDARSFALNGNILSRSTGLPADKTAVVGLLDGFFSERTGLLAPIPHAADSLRELSRFADVVLLSNIPAAYEAARTANLLAHGMVYPLFVNEGNKGPAVQRLADRRTGRVIFIDDIPHYLASAREHVPHAHLVHFMQDERFARHVPPLDFVALRTNDWRTVRGHLLDLLNAAGSARQSG